jgi:hypothetical protein
MGFRKLSDAERSLHAAFPRGAWVDLRKGDPDSDDPARGHGWGERRTLRAEVITALLLGAFDAVPGSFPAVRIRAARITGRLDLMGAETGYALVCEGCLFEQPLRFVEATTKTVRIISSRMPGLNGARMRTEGLFNLYGSVIEGLLRLDQAHVVGEVFLMGAHVGDGSGEAIAAKGLIVDGDVQCNDGFTARGSINLRGARIAGRLSFRGAVLDAEKSAESNRSGLHLSQLQAAELDLRAARPITGGIRLSNAHVGTLDDDRGVWPRYIWLNGFTYDYIHAGQAGRISVADRLDWVNRDTLGYRPQPYEELAAFYRRIGHDEDARRVLLAKQRHRRATLHWSGRAFGRLLDWTVGYGYRPWLAAIWLAALLAVGTAAFAIHRPRLIAGGPMPPFNAFTYTLDLLVPIGPFGLRGAYASTGAAQWLANALVAAGWILATTVIAGITRALRRD